MNEHGLMDDKDLGPTEELGETPVGADGTLQIGDLTVTGLVPARRVATIYVRRGTGKSFDEFDEFQFYNDIAQIIIEVAGVAANDAALDAEIEAQVSWPLGESHYVSTHFMHEDGSPLAPVEIAELLVDPGDEEGLAPRSE